MSPEFELTDTGVFEGNRYFDVVVEYAKSGMEDILARISVTNHGPERADLHLLPTVWFRSTWSWGNAGTRPVLRKAEGGSGTIELEHPEMGRRQLECEGARELLFTENETNFERLVRGEPEGSDPQRGVHAHARGRRAAPFVDRVPGTVAACAAGDAG